MKRFRFGLIIIILFLGSMCSGATKYVATDGNDTTGDGSIGNPWQTIQYAFSQIGDGDTIKVEAGTYHETQYNYLLLGRAITATIESQSGSNDVWVKPNNTGRIIQPNAAGTFIFNNMSFMPIGASCTCLCDGISQGDYTIIFNNCLFDSNGLTTTAGAISTGSGTGESAIFNGCTITLENETLYGAFRIENFDVFEVNDCDITQGGTSSYTFRFNNDSNMLKIRDCNIIAGGVARLITIATAGTDDSLDHLIVTGNIATGFSNFIDIEDEDVRFAKICDNTINATVDGFFAIDIGIDSASWTNILYGFVIKNNTITKNTSIGAVRLGRNCEAAEFSHNVITSTSATNEGLIIWGKYNNIHHNIVHSCDPIYLYYDAWYNKIQYNTAKSVDRATFAWGYGGKSGVQKGNVVTNNIFDASDSTTSAMKSALSLPYDNYIDYNCYVAGAAGLTQLNGSFQQTLSETQAVWAAQSDTWPLNDAHSIAADPQFIDAANGNFKLKPTSPCLNTGKPTLDGGYTSIGAWQRKSLLR